MKPNQLEMKDFLQQKIREDGKIMYNQQQKTICEKYLNSNISTTKNSKCFIYIRFV